MHPNCKYDARCTKPDCPFTHVSRRSAGAPPPRLGRSSKTHAHCAQAFPSPNSFVSKRNVSTAAQPTSAKTTCRFFPDCKNLDCQFYHPKVKTKSTLSFLSDCPVKTGCSKLHLSVFYSVNSLCCVVLQPCHFAAQCKRAGCTFYHPTTSVPPRHALKWTKAQSRWSYRRQMARFFSFTKCGLWRNESIKFFSFSTSCS